MGKIPELKDVSRIALGWVLPEGHAMALAGGLPPDEIHLYVDGSKTEDKVLEQDQLGFGICYLRSSRGYQPVTRQF